MRHRVVATATTVAIVAAFAFNTQYLSRLHAQNDANPAFEVASVKTNKANDGRVMIGFQPGGRFTATGVTLRMLIAQAYGLGQPLSNSQMIGGPDWIDRLRFDIIAKADGDVVPGPNGPLPLMMRSLLADRFQLAVHTESRELPIYALVLSKSDGSRGPQLKPATADCAAMRGLRGGPPPGPPAPGERPPCRTSIGPGNISGSGTTMAQLASLLGRLPALNRVVVDRTGLTGGFDVDLTWTPDQMPQIPPGGPPPGAPPLPPIDPNGPSIFAAVQEQLGLKLESTRGPVDVIVIDRAEQPTED